MALPSGMSDRQTDRGTGKRNQEGAAEEKAGRTSGWLSGSTSRLLALLWDTFSDTELAVSHKPGCGTGTGKLLVLSASGCKIPEDGEYEGL